MISLTRFLLLFILAACTAPDPHKVERDTAAFKAQAQALRCHIESLVAEMEDWERVQRAAIRIIKCESGWRHDGLWGDGGRSYGIAQFQFPTFARLARAAGFEGAEWHDRNHQISLLKWALANGHGREWTCYRKGDWWDDK